MQRQLSPAVGARPDLAGGGAEVHARAARAASVHIAWRSTVSQACARGSPRSSRRQLAPPLRVHVDRGPPTDARCAARPSRRPSAAPRHYRDRAGCSTIGKPMSPIFFGIALADALPAPRRAIEAVDAAVVLLIEPVGLQRMLHHAVRIVAEGDVRIGQEVGRDALVERRPVAPAIGRLEHPADRDRQYRCRGIARIDQDRVQQLAVGVAVAPPTARPSGDR